MKNRYEASPAVRVPIIWDHKTWVCPCFQCRVSGFKLLEDFLRRVGGDSRV